MANNRAFLTHDIENSLEDGEGKIAGKIYERKVTLTAAQIKDLTTPKELIPAPGVGRLLEFIVAIMKHNAATAFVEPDTADDCVIQYDSGTDLSGDITTLGFLTVTDDEIRRVPTTLANSVDLEAEVNRAIQLHNLDSEYTTGTGTLDIRIIYRIHEFN